MIQASRKIQQQRGQHYKAENTYPSQVYENEDQNLLAQKRSTYDDEFNSIYEEIVNHQYFSKISKHEKIRINKWLTKLSNISTNDLWKKNRNNYIKLIRLMFDCELIIAPFLMMPPERDLHKLTPHEINVIIDQVDKLIDERESKANQNKGSDLQKLRKVQWVQESAYINHHQNSSIQKSKNSEKEAKRTFETSSVTAHLSKFSENPSSVNLIPPKHPSTTKHKSIEKNQSVNKQNYFMKTSKNIENQDNRQYFMKKQKIETFETEQLGQQEYLTMMKNSVMQQSPQVLQNNRLDLQAQSRDAINILKCGFRLLQKIPLSSLEPSSIQEIQTFRRILCENDVLKSELQKENVFLEELSNRCHTIGQKALHDSNSLGNTLKTKQNERKKKLSLTSQSTTKS